MLRPPRSFVPIRFRVRSHGVVRLLFICGVQVALGACGGSTPKSDATRCAPGSLGCACGEASACGEGLSCEDGLCRAALKRRVTIGDSRARACELLFAEREGAHLLGATFEDSVQGTFVAERPRVAVAVSARADRPIAGSAIALIQAEGAGSVELKKSTCFDGRGAALPDAVVTLADSK